MLELCSVLPAVTKRRLMWRLCNGFSSVQIWGAAEVKFPPRRSDVSDCWESTIVSPPCCVLIMQGATSNDIIKENTIERRWEKGHSSVSTSWLLSSAFVLYFYIIKSWRTRLKNVLFVSELCKNTKTPHVTVFQTLADVCTWIISINVGRKETDVDTKDVTSFNLKIEQNAKN